MQQGARMTSIQSAEFKPNNHAPAMMTGLAKDTADD